MKKLAGVLAACMLLGSVGTMTVAAEDKVVVGTRLQFAEGSGPVIISDRLMLPLRAVSEALDATVYWFNDDKRIQIVRYDTVISLQINNKMMGKYAIRNGSATQEEQPVELEVAPTIHNDRTYVPIRAISEAFSAEVQWDNPNRTAVILPHEVTENKVHVADVAYQSEGALCSVVGVIAKSSDGTFYLRSLQKNGSGSYDKVFFGVPTKTDADGNSVSYESYITEYWNEQFATADPSGTVVAYTGVKKSADGYDNLMISKTTTGIRSLGYYDDYMSELGVNYEAFVNELSGNSGISSDILN